MLGGWMRAGAAAFALCACVAAAHAEPAPASDQWVGESQALVRRIVAEDLLLTDVVRARQQVAAAALTGRARLQALYDIAADDLVASSAERSALSLPALERAAAGDARYSAMAAMLRAYAPSLDGDYMRARRQFQAILPSVRDAHVRAAGQRLLSYVLTDLGLVGNALEAARAGFNGLPEEQSTLSLRAGLHDAMSYTYMKVGDDASAFAQMRRAAEYETAAGRPIDGQSIAYNVATLLAHAEHEAASLRAVDAVAALARRTGDAQDAFFADLLCAKINLAAHRYAPAASCAEEGRAAAAAPREYVGQLLLISVVAHARLGDASAARAALTDLRRHAAERDDPALIERIALAEPEVLFAEGNLQQAFQAMRDAHERDARETMNRFNAGVRELRATMENEVARAEERAIAQELKSSLQKRRLEVLMLTASLAGACFLAAAIIALLIYRSRRAMLAAVGRAEAVLIGGGGDRVKASRSLQRRLEDMLDEIARRDSALRVLVEDLKVARAAAEEANVAKSHFLATISHELRTPLNAIIGYSEILQEGAEADKRSADARDLGRVINAAGTLLTHINDLLDLSKAESGKLLLSPARFDVAALVGEAVAIVKPAALANANRLHVDVAPDLGFALSDAMRINQCLLNLLSNAVKFTKAGDVHVRVVRERNAKGDWLSFEVADTGIGIAPENIGKLFQAFSQAESSTTRTYGGTGLGLAITRRLAHLLGGDVSVQSEPRRGSVFTVRVPAEIGADARLAA